MPFAPINTDQHVRGPQLVESGPVRVIPDVRFGAGAIAQPPREVLDRAGNTFERALNVAALTEPSRVVLGRDRIGAQILNAWNYGSSLLVAVQWCRGPIDAFEAITLDNETMPAAILRTNYLGTSGQTVNAKLVTALAALGVSHTATFAGQAYSVLEFPVGTDLGEIHATLRGIKAYDPRNGAHFLATPSTWTWTDNPAVLLAALITNADWGMGAALDWTGSIPAFDACDALVSGEKKHLIGLTLDRRLKASEWVEIVRAHAGCFVVRTGATYKLVPDAPASSVMTFSKANRNLIDGSFRWRRLGLEEQPNVVAVTYTDTTALPWRAVEITVPSNGLPPSGQELRLSRINLPGAHRHSQAVRVATERGNYGSLAGIEYTWEARGTAVSLQRGDIVTVDDGALFAGVQMRVTRTGLKGKYETTISARHYDPAIYSSTANAAPTYPISTLPSAANPPSITGLTLAEISETPTTSRIAVSWTAVSWPFLAGYRVLVYDEDRLVHNELTSPSIAGITVPPVPVGRRYQIRVLARSSVAEGPQTPGFITLAGVSTEIPGEMLFAEFDIRPAAGFGEDTNGYGPWRRGMFDTYEGRAYRWGASGATIDPIAWQSIPNLLIGTSSQPFSDATNPIETYVALSVAPPPFVPPGESYEPPVVPQVNLWQSSAITLWAGTPRLARLVADIPTRTVGSFSAYELTLDSGATVIASNGAITAASVTVSIDTARSGGGAFGYFEIAWPGKLRVYVATVTEGIPETAPLTSTASGALTVTMQRVYERLRFAPNITPLGTASRSVVISNIVYGATSTTFDVRIFEGTTQVAAPFTYNAEGVEKL